MELAQDAMDAVNGRTIWPELSKFLGIRMVPPRVPDVGHGAIGFNVCLPRFQESFFGPL